MNDVVYEYGCEVTSTVECPLNEEIRADERKKAEQDFQNSDYWNEYLAKVIADAKAEVINEFMDKLPYSAMVRMSTIEKIVEQLKEQNNAD